MFRRSVRLTFLRFVPWLLVAGVHSKKTNVTIDDVYGDAVTSAVPTYSGPSFITGVPGGYYTTCAYEPDPSQCFKATFHDMFAKNLQPPQTVPYTVSFKFTGSIPLILLALLLDSLQELRSISYMS